MTMVDDDIGTMGVPVPLGVHTMELDTFHAPNSQRVEVPSGDEEFEEQHILQANPSAEGPLFAATRNTSNYHVSK